MNIKYIIPSFLSFSRVIFSGIFYILVVYFFTTIPVIILFLCFFIIEISDMLDGWIARKLSVVSDFGKLFDPICDISTHFLCIFALEQVGIAPPLVLVLFIFREIWVTFMRSVLLLKKNRALAAQLSGKIKTWFYGMSIFASIFVFPQSAFYDSKDLFLQPLITVLFYISGALSIFSGIQYFIVVYRIFISPHFD